jgi:predicted transcriptional regulator
MKTAKELMTEVIDQQPDDSSYDELLRELAFRRMIVAGLADLDAGRVVSDEEVRRKIEAWQA